MEAPYIQWARVENFRCVKSVDIRLTRLHALIGPNDSGKSTLLRGVAHGTLWVNLLEDGAVVFRLENSNKFSWGHYPIAISSTGPWGTLPERARTATQPMTLLRLDPDSMRAPAYLLSDQERIWFRDERGGGLSAMFDALVSRDVPAFLSINARFTTLFPTVRALRMVNTGGQQKSLGLTLSDGTEVGPEAMSEGMLYWLAFAVIEHLSPRGVLLIEEPENGLHPSRIAEVMKVFREVSKRTQIIMATHSPLVINELEPEEVTLVTRTAERGTICTPMTKTTNFAQRSREYALGELWLSYADGDTESKLVPSGTDPGVSKAG